MRLRSLLFVPGDSERKFAKAMTAGADGLILDLEDSVAPVAKGRRARPRRGAARRQRPRATGRSSCASMRSIPA